MPMTRISAHNSDHKSVGNGGQLVGDEETLERKTLIERDRNWIRTGRRCPGCQGNRVMRRRSQHVGKMIALAAIGAIFAFGSVRSSPDSFTRSYLRNSLIVLAVYACGGIITAVASLIRGRYACQDCGRIFNC